MLPFGPSASPLWNAAGTLGFALPKRCPLNLALGAFVTNPISWGPRTPAQGPRLVEYPGGLLLHTGLPNPGFWQVLQQYSVHWTRMSLPVIVHLIAETVETVSRMVRRLEEVEGVAGIELGLPPAAGLPLIDSMIEAARGELPLIVALPPDGVRPSVQPDAIRLAPPRGTLPVEGQFVQGRLLGPGIFPQMLHAVRTWVSVGIPILAGGGVYHPAQAEALFAAGASVVQLDLRLWQFPWPDEAWEKWLAIFPSKSSLAHR